MTAMTPLVQSAEQGAYPEVMCATETELDQAAYYGPTGWMNFRGPVGNCNLDPHMLDRGVATRLWDLSEKQTGLSWPL
ncbi:hypothetical protein Q4485_07355 [Granulosicoccaceae sp. 1_MG-2023]|nr:hypothetical protein [Granulosicoccaceae sp. 1_MG-2023]